MKPEKVICAVAIYSVSNAATLEECETDLLAELTDSSP